MRPRSRSPILAGILDTAKNTGDMIRYSLYASNRPELPGRLPKPANFMIRPVALAATGRALASAAFVRAAEAVTDIRYSFGDTPERCLVRLGRPGTAIYYGPGTS